MQRMHSNAVAPAVSGRWLVLAIVSSALLLIVVDMTVLYTALPRLTHELLERDSAEVHGLGETALPPVPAAIGNALASRGAHLTELPMTPERVLEAL